MSTEVSTAVRADLAAYLPHDRRRAILQGRELPERQHGAALFADLSGFTALTERFSQRLGPLRGAEEMGVWLRRVYEPLIARVEEEGGSVLGFAGDAITCFFDDDDGSAALRVARRMQDDVTVIGAVHAADGQQLGIRLKVAVSVGPVRRFSAGDPSRRLFDVMAGETLLRLALHEGNAKPGDIVIDPGIASHLNLQVQEMREDTAVVRPPHPDRSEDEPGPETLAADASGRKAREAVETLPTTRHEPELPSVEGLTPWVPEVARDRALSGAGALGDFRPAGALFLSFAGIDWDQDPEAGVRIDRFLRHVQQELADFGGTLIQVTVGDKGSYLYAAFGAPKAQGDDAERAVACALRLVNIAGPEVGSVTRLRAGVAYGAMFTGRYGATARTTYGVLGPKTNLAARLMKRASDGEVMCDPEVARRARKRIAFTALKPEAMKGVAAPVHLQRAERELEPDERVAGPMFGRDDERHEIGSLLTHLAHGTGAVLRFEAEAGAGKTRLLQWASESAEERRLKHVALGQAREEGGPSFYRFAEPLRVLLGLPTGTSFEVIRRAVADRAHAEEERDEKDRKEADRFEDPLSAAFAEGAVRTFARAARERPLLLVVDDMHRIDRPSTLLLGRIVALTEIAPVAVIMAGRPAEDKVAVQIEAAVPVRPRRLEGLEPEASRMVVAQVLNVPALTVPYAVATAIHERAVGLPALVEEIARDLVDRGALRSEAAWEGIGRGGRGRGVQKTAARVTFDEAALRDLDSNLDALLVARLDRLTASERTAMKTAAVLGMTAEHQPLAHLLESDPVALESALTPLEAPDMLEAMPEAHRFRQQVLQGVAYETLLFEQRRELHRKMTAWYQEREAQGLPTDLERMAFHAFAAAEGEEDAEVVQPAIRVLQRLADQYRGEGEIGEAIEVWERIAKLVPRSDDWIEERCRVGLVAAGLQAWRGELDAAERDYQRVLGQAREAEHVPGEVAALLGRVTLQLERGAFDEAEGVLQQVGSAVEGTERPVLIVAERIAAARLAEARGQLEDAVDKARGATLAARLDRGAKALALAAWLEHARARLAAAGEEPAEERIGPAIQLAREFGRLDLELEAMLLAGARNAHLKEWREAEGAYREAERRADDIGAVLYGQRARIGVARAIEATAVGRIEADGAWRSVLEEGLRTGCGPVVAAAALGRARVAAKHSFHAWAVGVTEAALRAPYLTERLREQAQRLKEALTDTLGARTYAAHASERAQFTLEQATGSPDHTLRSSPRGRGV